MPLSVSLLYTANCGSLSVTILSALSKSSGIMSGLSTVLLFSLIILMLFVSLFIISVSFLILFIPL